MHLKVILVLLVAAIALVHARRKLPSDYDDGRLINRPTFPKPGSHVLRREGSRVYRDVADAESMMYRDHAESMYHRARRSPEDNKGSVVVSGSHTKGQFGQPSQQSVRGEYNHNLWRGKNGATVDANTYYQRNWGGGPRQDYGGGVRATIPFGRR